MRQAPVSVGLRTCECVSLIYIMCWIRRSQKKLRSNGLFAGCISADDRCQHVHAGWTVCAVTACIVRNSSRPTDPVTSLCSCLAGMSRTRRSLLTRFQLSITSCVLASYYYYTKAIRTAFIIVVPCQI